MLFSVYVNTANNQRTLKYDNNNVIRYFSCLSIILPVYNMVALLLTWSFVRSVGRLVGRSFVFCSVVPSCASTVAYGAATVDTLVVSGAARVELRVPGGLVSAGNIAGDKTGSLTVSNGTRLWVNSTLTRADAALYRAHAERVLLLNTLRTLTVLDGSLDVSSVSD